ncbi:Rossmann-fold NAD(P)-binding domain-containing protein [Novosphingobium panipatense]|uniref:hypothetical protein n=1 Tax=Novosphingobium panipatense TaxID=428991 RepID=UPI003613791B
MDVAVFSTRSYDREFLDLANAAAGNSHALRYFDAGLSEQTMALAAGSDAICAFVNDHLDRNVLAALHGQGTKLIALRCAGFNHVDLEAAEALKIAVARVPAYSPQQLPNTPSRSSCRSTASCTGPMSGSGKELRAGRPAWVQPRQPNSRDCGDRPHWNARGPYPSRIRMHAIGLRPSPG